MNLEINTLYYTFSSISQVLAAIAAIIGAFMHFRINNLRDFLIGDGKSVLARSQCGETGYELPDKQQKRLRDAIYRKNVSEIKAVIRLLRDKEEVEGHTKAEGDRPWGLQYLYDDRFCVTEKHINQLKKWTLCTVGFAFFTIILSVISLGLSDTIYSTVCCSLKHTVLFVNILFCIISLILAYYIIWLSFQEQTKHETDRKLKDKGIK